MGTLVFSLALGLAALMGFAMQRGATCMVAAVDEVLSKRRANRLLAIAEASIWVLGAMLLTHSLDGDSLLMPVGYQISAWGLTGAFLLGIGATINGACVFGTVARFGSGEWVYCLTPVGFLAGCFLVRLPGVSFMAYPVQEPSIVQNAPIGVLLLILVWMTWRVLWPMRQLKIRQLWQSIQNKLWAPHAATLVIGLTFVGLLHLVGPWTYTDMLADWAQQGITLEASRGLLFVTLFLGAAWGGWTAQRYRLIPITLLSGTRCLLGGVLMGVGSLLMPGGNDGLILTGMPLLWPYAWLSFLTMFVAIAASLKLQSRIA